MEKDELKKIIDSFLKDPQKGFKKITKYQDAKDLFFIIGNELLAEEKWDNLILFYQMVMDFLKDQSDLLNYYKILINLSSILISLDDIDSSLLVNAKKELEEAENFFNRNNYTEFVPKAVLLQGILEMEFEDYEESMRIFSKGIKIYKEQKISEDNILGWLMFYKAQNFYYLEESVPLYTVAELLEKANSLFKENDDLEGEQAILEFLQDLDSE